jgi:hypothetical protein
VPGQKQPKDESGLEIGHRSKEQREFTSCEPARTPKSVQPLSIAQICLTIGFMVEVAF